MGRNKDLSEFDKDQIIMARQQGQNRIVGWSQSAVVRIYQQWSEEGQTGDRVFGAQCSSCSSSQWRLSHEGYLFWSEPTEGLLMMIMGGMCHNVAANQSEHLWWPLPTLKSTYNRHASTGTGHWRSVYMCSVYLGKQWHQDSLWDKGRWRQCGTLGSVLLGQTGSNHSCRCKFDVMPT